MLGPACAWEWHDILALMDQIEPKRQPQEGSRERDEPLVTSIGDLVLSEPQVMRALADPFRLALLDRLQRDGPATDAELASTLHASRSSIQEHLHELERFGLITCCGDAADAAESRWCAVAKGIFFEIPTDPLLQHYGISYPESSFNQRAWHWLRKRATRWHRQSGRSLVPGGRARVRLGACGWVPGVGLQ